MPHVFFSLVIFTVLELILFSFYIGGKNLSEHEKMAHISIALCGERLAKPSIVCSPEYSIHGIGIDISILGRDKEKQMSVEEINKIIVRAKEIKPLLTKGMLQINFKIQKTTSETYNKVKRMRARTFSYKTYKTVML